MDTNDKFPKTVYMPYEFKGFSILFVVNLGPFGDLLKSLLTGDNIKADSWQAYREDLLGKDFVVQFLCCNENVRLYLRKASQSIGTLWYVAQLVRSSGPFTSIYIYEFNGTAHFNSGSWLLDLVMDIGNCVIEAQELKEELKKGEEDRKMRLLEAVVDKSLMLNPLNLISLVRYWHSINNSSNNDGGV